MELFVTNQQGADSKEDLSECWAKTVTPVAVAISPVQSGLTASLLYVEQQRIQFGSRYIG